MSVVIKAFLKSLVGKKARTFLVLFSIAISAAMVFANEAFSTTVTQRFYEADTRWAGNADFSIETQSVVGAKEWIDPAKLSQYPDTFEYAFSFIKEKALFMPSLEKMHYFMIIGADMEEYNRINPVTLSQGDLKDWNGFKIVIGKTYADLYHLQLNDVMKLELNNVEYDFQIAGISEPKGLFLRELADGGHLLAPKDTLAKIFNGTNNLMFLKMKDRSSREDLKVKLDQDFLDYVVRYGINDAVIAAETQNYVIPFQASSIVVVVMCMFIIFTAFNLITLERIPIIGTLRSIGSTRRKINIILVAESAGLGAVGGLIGCVLGLGILQYIKSLYFTGDDASLNSTLIFGAKEVLTAVGAAVLITTASAILPILRLTRTPIKNIILNDLEKKAGKKSLLWVSGIVLMVACVVVPPFLANNFTGMIVACTLATGALIGLIPLVPFVTAGISRLIGKIPFLSQEVVLGVRNIRDNSNLMNNIQFFSASIAIIAFMASMFNTMGADLLKAFDKEMKFDVRVTLRHSDPSTLVKLSQIDGIESAAGNYMSHVQLLNYQTFINALVGIDNPDYFRFNTVRELENNQEALAQLNDGKYVITTNVLKGKFGLKKCDTMLLQFGSKPVAYTITGFVETNLGIGHAAFISSSNYKEDMGVVDYDNIYVRGNDNPDKVKNNILRAFGKEVMSINTKQELTASNADKVVGTFNAISTYCYMALLVGIIGIINNLVVSFIERRRSFAMYRCIGMSKKGLNRMLMAEAVAMGVFGISFGILTALIMSSTIPVAVSVFWGKVTVQLAVKEMAIIAAVGILAMLAISVVPVTRSEKMSLIETIKYE